MNEIEFSIIIPVFNQEKYIEQCVLSALNQNFDDNYEIIAINDGSKDKSFEIIEKFKDCSKLRIYDNENRGVSYSRNFGLKEARGKYIIFLDADDYLEKNALQNLKKANPKCDADIMLAPFYAIRENRRDIKEYLPLAKKLFHEAGNACKAEFKNVQNTKGKILEANFELCTKAYRKSFLNENSIDFLPFKTAEDLPFFYSTMLNAKKILICKEPVYYYRKGHKEGFSKEAVDETMDAILKTDSIVKNSPHYENIKNIYLKNTCKVLWYWCKKFKKLPNKNRFYMFCLKIIVGIMADI